MSERERERVIRKIKKKEIQVCFHLKVIYMKMNGKLKDKKCNLKKDYNFCDCVMSVIFIIKNLNLIKIHFVIEQ